MSLRHDAVLAAAAPTAVPAGGAVPHPGSPLPGDVRCPGGSR